MYGDGRHGPPLGAVAQAEGPIHTLASVHWR